MKKILISAVMAVLLAGCREAREEPAAPPEPENLAVVSVGDSLTQGVGDSTEAGGYIPYLEEDLEALDTVADASFVNYGKRGNRSDQLLKRLQDKAVQADLEKADLVIVTIGGNDVVQVAKKNWSSLTKDVFEQEKTGYKERVKQIITDIRAVNGQAGIVLVGIYNPFGRIFIDTQDDENIVEEWNEEAEKITASFNRTAFVNVADIFGEGSDGLFYEDQFHPNDAGYERIAGRIFETIDGEALEQLTAGKIEYVNEGSS